MSIKSTLTIGILLLTSIKLSAINDSTKPKFFINEIATSFAIGSNHLNSFAALPFIFRGNINQKNIEKSTVLLMAKNRTGIIANAGIKFSVQEYNFSINSALYSGFSYSKDFFLLLFKGNSQSAGKVLNLGMNGKQIGFYTLQYIHKNINYKNKWQLQIAPEVYVINNYASIKTKGKNTLFTSENGQNIIAELNYNAYQNTNAISGFGFGSSFLAYKIEGNKISSWRVKNLGISLLPNNLRVFSQDTNWNYSGFNFTLGQNFSVASRADSLRRLLYIESRQRNRITMMPIQISYGIEDVKKIISFNYMAMPGYLPQISYMKKLFKANHRIDIGAQMGGWSLLNSKFGLSTQLNKQKQQKLVLEIIGIESLLINYPGFGACLKINW